MFFCFGTRQPGDGLPDDAEAAQAAAAASTAITDSDALLSSSTHSDDEESKGNNNEDGELLLTVEQLVERVGFGWFQAKLMLVISACTAADAMEICLLSFLSPVLACEWLLTPHDEALITTVVVLGMLVGAPLWGVFADSKRGGRRRTTIVIVLLMFVSGVLSGAITVGLVSLLLLRAAVGLSLAGLHVPYCLASEYLPRAQRATLLTILSGTWVVGACGIALLTWAVLPWLGWRWLRVLAAMPYIGVLAMSSWIPESARWHMVHGEHAAAQRIAERMQRDNQYHGRAIRLREEPDQQQQQQQQQQDDADNGGTGWLTLLSPAYRTSSLLIWIGWIGVSFCYYSTILLLTSFFRDDVLPAASAAGGSSCTDIFSSMDYIRVLSSSLAEVPGYVFAAYLIDTRFFGRVRGMAFLSLCGAASLTLLLLPSEALQSVGFAAARAAFAGVFMITWQYATELFPTVMRATAMGTASAFARVGGAVAPFVGQVVAAKSPSSAVIVLIGASLLMMVAQLALPKETRGAIMHDNITSSGVETSSSSSSSRHTRVAALSEDAL
jgi:MFS family permease